MFEDLLRDFRNHVAGRSSLGETASRSLEPHLWSAIANTKTVASVECLTPQDVVMAVRIACDHGQNVSALGGGHDWVGRSVCNGGVTLDLRPLDTASFDGTRGIVVAGGGALVGTALNCLPEDHAVVTGVSKGVGLTGLALGGGYGKLNSRFGLVTDTLKRVELILDNGRLVNASESEHPDLFWALRGAGKNFGIVTSAEYAAFSLPKVLTGKIFYPLQRSRAGLLMLQEALDEESDYLSIFASFLSLPHIGFGLVLEPLWTGGQSEGERLFDRLCGNDFAVTIERDWRCYRDVFDDQDGAAKRRAYKMDAFNILRLSEALIDVVTDLANASPSRGNTIMFHDFHGFAARVPSSSTAFPLREDHFNLQVVAGWAPEDAKGRRDAEIWLEQIRIEIGPFVQHGGYPAVLGYDHADRARDFYGLALDSIQLCKKQYDPNNRFAAAFGLP